MAAKLAWEKEVALKSIPVSNECRASQPRQRALQQRFLGNALDS